MEPPAQRCGLDHAEGLPVRLPEAGLSRARHAIDKGRVAALGGAAAAASVVGLVVAKLLAQLEQLLRQMPQRLGVHPLELQRIVWPRAHPWRLRSSMWSFAAWRDSRRGRLGLLVDVVVGAATSGILPRALARKESRIQIQKQQAKGHSGSALAYSAWEKGSYFAQRGRAHLSSAALALASLDRRPRHRERELAQPRKILRFLFAGYADLLKSWKFCMQVHGGGWRGRGRLLCQRQLEQRPVSSRAGGHLAATGILLLWRPHAELVCCVCGCTHHQKLPMVTKNGGIRVALDTQRQLARLR